MVMVFPVVMYSCESWTIKKAKCQRTDVFERWCWRRLLRVPWAEGRSNQSILREIKPERTDVKAEVTVFWSYDTNNQLIGKVRNAGKDWGQKEKRASEDKMAGWHHGWNGHELGQTLGDGEGQEGLVCCSPWGCKELDSTGRLNNKKKRTQIEIWPRELRVFAMVDFDWSWNLNQVRKCLGPGGSVVKNPPASAGNAGSIPG